MTMKVTNEIPANLTCQRNEELQESAVVVCLSRLWGWRASEELVESSEDTKNNQKTRCAQLQYVSTKLKLKN